MNVVGFLLRDCARRSRVQLHIVHANLFIKHAGNYNWSIARGVILNAISFWQYRASIETEERHESNGL
jgi:hypothetical protein